MTWQDETYGWPTQPLPQRRRRRWPGLAALLLVVVTAFGLAVFAGDLGLGPGVTAITRSLVAHVPTPAPDTSGTHSTATLDLSIADRVNPGIVNIDTTLGLQRAKAAGTGVVLSADGLVLTNNHVIAGSTRIDAVSVGTGAQYAATVLGYDQSHDIALVRLDGASALPTVTTGDSSTVAIGAPVMALGNAGGRGGTPLAVTGSVTGLERSITATDESGRNAEDLTGLIEVAADIQPGDSGGPLVDAQGRVIGINTATTTGGQSGLATKRGYAVPINDALAIVAQIQAGQASETVHIGATAFLGVETISRRSSGAAVVRVVDGSPAEQAGLAAGDVIVTLDGTTIESPATLGVVLYSRHPNDSVTLSWTDRFGERHEATVQLADGPPV